MRYLANKRFVMEQLLRWAQRDANQQLQTRGLVLNNAWEMLTCEISWFKHIRVRGAKGNGIDAHALGRTIR
jgi:hypothetical protein